ncbi:MAG: hypothetical protein ABIR37_03180 [Candidatus Saccharimonadales bacterium]
MSLARFRRLKNRILVNRRQLYLSLAVVAAIVLVGSILLLTKAAGSIVSTETETGTKSTQAVQVSDATASAGKAVKFTPPSLTPTCTGKPNATCTGVPVGTTLTIVTGDQTYSTDGQVLSGLDIRGNVQITGKNITIKNSIIRGGNLPCTNSNQNTAPLWVRSDVGATNFTFQDSELYPSNPTACQDGIWASNITILRANIHGAVDGIKADNNITVKDSYIHDLSWFASDPNQGGGQTHNDGLQTYRCNSNILVQHNNIDLSTTTNGNAAYQITQDYGIRCVNIVIDDNWLDGGGCTINIAHKTLANLTGVALTNNRFGRTREYANCTVLLSTQSTLSAYTGNVWEDTGLPIPAPQVHD